MREEEFIDWMDDKELKYVIFLGGKTMKSWEWC